jgi:HEAT repeats
VAGLVLLVASRGLARPVPHIEDVEDSLAHDRSYKVRVDAALVLGRLRQTRSIPALIGGLRDGNPAVRASSARALGQIGSPIARDAVAKVLLDPVPLVRRMAKIAMRDLGGEPDTMPSPSANAPSIRARPAKKMSFEVKAMGDNSNHAGQALRSHMRDFLVDKLRPLGDVDPGPNQGAFAVDGVIKDLSTNTRAGEVEVTCAVQLVLSRQPGGGVFLLTSGEATVQRPKRQFKPPQRSGMELEALESAVRSASEDLVAQLSRQ